MAEKQIIDVISKFAATGKSGTVMVVFEDNSLGRFYLISGEIVAARYRNRQGHEAVDAANSLGVSVDSAKFYENTDLVRSSQLVNVKLELSDDPQHTDDDIAGNSAQPFGPRLTLAKRTALGELLSEYIGPVAGLVMTELPDVVSVRSAIDQISREIDDNEMASNFIRAANRINR